MRGWRGAFVALPSGLVVHAGIAADEASRVTGYASVDHPPSFGTGILFVFPQPGLVPFTMAETRFPLDLAFMIARSRVEGEIDADLVHIARGMPHHTRLYESPMPYDLCLETSLYSVVRMAGDGSRVRIRRTC